MARGDPSYRPWKPNCQMTPNVNDIIIGGISLREFADAVKEVTDYLGKQTKGNIFKIGRSKFKIKQTDLRRKEINIVIDDSIYGEGEAEIKWWTRRGGGGKVNSTLQVSSKKGAYASHLKTMLQAIKYLMDGTLEKGFTKAMRLNV